MKRTTKRQGFTLVELLIVIVVIGILSAMMMLSSTEAVTSAKASNIVSNLRNLKTAALAYYVDHMDAMEGAKTVNADDSSYNGLTFTKGSFSQDVAQYLNNNITDKGYSVSITDNGEWYVTYTIEDGASTATEQAGIITKLKGRAKSVGLCTNKTSADYYGKTADTTVVGMFVR